MGSPRFMDGLVSSCRVFASMGQTVTELTKLIVRRPGLGVPRLGRRGTGALEFALLAGPLMTVMFGFMATNVLFFTWSSMQDSAQYAARMMATGQVNAFSNGAISAANTTSSATCGSVSSGVVEYFACQGLPSWATFTVTATQDCAVPSVSVSVSVDAKAAALADVFSIFTGRTIVANSTMMKEGVCS